MRNLALPDRSDVEDHLSLAFSGDGDVDPVYVLQDQEIDAIIALYDLYDATSGTPSDALKGPFLDEDLKDAVEVAYGWTQKDKKLASIRSTLMSGVGLCPICSISPVTELDHFLPKARYKPLALYLRNLVPLCHHCNHFKGVTAGNAPERQFVHSYFDAMPENVILSASVDIAHNGLVVAFSIVQAAGVSADLAAKLTFQFARMRLNERYGAEINNYLVSHAVSLNMVHGVMGAAGVNAFLTAQANTEEVAFHRNHWRPILLRALSGHAHFCDGGFKDVLPAAAPLLA